MLWIWSANWFHAQVCNQKPISQKLSPCWIRLGSSMTDLILPNIYFYLWYQSLWRVIELLSFQTWVLFEVIVWIYSADSIKAWILLESRLWYSELYSKLKCIFFQVHWLRIPKSRWHYWQNTELGELKRRSAKNALMQPTKNQRTKPLSSVFQVRNYFLKVQLAFFLTFMLHLAVLWKAASCLTMLLATLRVHL